MEQHAGRHPRASSAPRRRWPIVMRPRGRRHPGDGHRAAVQPQPARDRSTPSWSATARSPTPSSRARRSRSSRWPARLEDGRSRPRTRFDLPADDQVTPATAYRVHAADERRARPARMTASRDPRALEQHRHLHDRHAGGQGPPAGLDLALRVRRRGPASTSRARWRATCARRGVVGTGVLNIPIGQGTAVTLTQLARAYAAIANGGTLVTPHLVAAVGGEERGPAGAAHHARVHGAVASARHAARGRGPARHGHRWPR